jgi:hypothetical protein
MDGSLAPIPVVAGGVTEAITVTPAFFSDGGWLSPSAYPRLTGLLLFLDSLSSSFLSRLSFLSLTPRLNVGVGDVVCGHD